ncbi:Protein of unknown function [Bacillus mycoides]|nr:Protein of unknown function [Bacillus mycoides]
MKTKALFERKEE